MAEIIVKVCRPNLTEAEYNKRLERIKKAAARMMLTQTKKGK